jgi:predicted DNA-binding ribbon-helix-helix protein
MNGGHGCLSLARPSRPASAIGPPRGLGGAVVDPVGAGYVASLARPGGNVTGLTHAPDFFVGGAIFLVGWGNRLHEGGVLMKSMVIKRSIVVAGHKTSVSLEDPFWSGLKEIATKRRTTLSALVDEIDKKRQHTNLSSALRLFVLDFYRSEERKLGTSDENGPDIVPATPARLS